MAMFRARPLIFGLLALAPLAGCGSQATTPSASADAAQLPADQVIYGLNHVMTKNGVRTAVLNGDTAYLFEDGRRFDLVGVRLQFFNESGVESGNLTSQTGEYNLASGLFIARGSVVLNTTTPEGTRQLRTEELHYDVTGDRLWSDVEFTMVENGRTTRGASFRSDANFRTWEITGGRTEGGIVEGTGGISF